jgi:hypothetical protein
MAATKHHDYHLVEPDPWPLLVAFSSLFLFIVSVKSVIEKRLFVGLLSFVFV